MFLDEARVASLLSHPNIVQIYEIGEVEGICYIAMEYIRGPNLKGFRKRLYERNPRPNYGLIAAITAQAAAGLHCAHQATDERGVPLHIVHRDVSPTNLLLSYTGAVKLVDFGVAKASIQEHKTKAGMVKGKYRYMSPEQILDDPIDHRSDIYALGAILYELATNVITFGRRSEAETIRAVYQDPIMPPTSLIEGFPATLNHITMKALSRDLDTRYESAEDMRKDLMAFMQERGEYFGPQEIANTLRGLFANEQENERTGLSGSSLSKADFIRFAIAPPSNRAQPTGQYSGAHQLPARHATDHFRHHDPIDSTMPSAQPAPRRDGSFQTAHPSFAFNALENTTPSGPSAPSAHAAHAALGTETQRDSNRTIDDHKSKPKSGYWLLISILLLAVLGGGAAVFWLLQGNQSPPKQTKTRQPTKRAVLPQQSFAHLAQTIEALLAQNQHMAASRYLPALKQSSQTDQQRKRAEQLQQRIECAPRFGMAKELFGRGSYQAALKSLKLLQEQCPLVPEIKILLQQVEQYTAPRTRPPHRRIRRRRRRRRRRPNRRTSSRRPTLRLPASNGTGKLFVNAPPTARVDLDGSLFGFAPINGKSLKAGRYALRIQLAGHQTYTRTITVRTARPTVVNAKLVPIAKTRTRIAPRLPAISPRPVVPPAPPRTVLPPTPRTRSRGPRLAFSSIRLPKRRVLRVFITDTRGIVGRTYTGQHPQLCRQIERELKRVMGPNYAISGITQAWQQFVKQHGARLGRDRLAFYPRAVAYVIYHQLKRGRSPNRVAQIVVNYERRQKWKRYANR
jgi:serine/threonine-protein kinase